MSGAAILHLNRGVYVAEHAHLSGDVVTYTGQLRVSDVQGDRLYQQHTRSVRLRAGEWIDWADAEQEASAAA